MDEELPDHHMIVPLAKNLDIKLLQKPAPHRPNGPKGDDLGFPPPSEKETTERTH